MMKIFCAYVAVKVSYIFPVSSLPLPEFVVCWGRWLDLHLQLYLPGGCLDHLVNLKECQPKRQALSSCNSVLAAHSPAPLAPLVIHPSEEDLQVQNVVDEFFQPLKPTLGQIVRQKLSEGRKVTCRLLGVILEESTPEELQQQATVRSSVLEVLLEITKYCDIYLIERVLDDHSEKKRYHGFDRCWDLYIRWFGERQGSLLQHREWTVFLCKATGTRLAH